MAVVIDTGEIAIAQGNSVRHMKQWDEDDKFVGKAENDLNDASWGRKLQKNSKGEYIFEDSYICFSFLVKRDAFTEFWYPGYVTFKINDEQIWFQKNFGPKYSGEPESEQNIYIYASCNDATGDKRTLVHINVPTRRISHMKTIKSITCSIGYGLGWVNNTGEKTWNFIDNNIKVHQYYRWFKDGKVYNLANSGSDDGNGNNGYFQTPKSIKRKDTTSTKITFNSKQLENTTNSNFFTGENGKINLIFSLEKYLHNSLYRVPNQCILNGEIKEGSVETGAVTIKDIDSKGELIADSIITHTINSSELARFKNITSAQILFKGHESDEIKNITITNDSFKNCDLYENVPIKIQIDDENIINHYDKMTETEVTLHSLLQGTITTPTNYPFSFGTSTNAKLMYKNNSGEYKNIYSKVQISSNNLGQPTIEIKENYTGSIKSDGKFGYNRSCEPGTIYYLGYTVTNLLKTETAADNRGKYFNFTGNEAEIKFVNNPSPVYVALGKPAPSIVYKENNKLYPVPGSIILDWESIYFENNEDNAFKVFNLNDKTLVEGVKGYIKINDIPTNYEVGPGKSHYCGDLKKDRIDSNTTTNVAISYFFKKDNANLTVNYPFKDHFVFGRLTKNPILEVLKTQESTIRYYLKDNTGDKDLQVGNKVLSSNQLINRRGNKEGYFSLSRQPKDNEAINQETLTVQIKIATEEKDENGQIKYDDYGDPLNLKVTEDNFKEVLELLKENQTNSFVFSDKFFDPEDIKGIDFTEIETQVGFDLTLYYNYRDINNTETLKKELLQISIRNISFSTTIEPIGLRKRGVIINPEKNQDLGSMDNFQINVNNNTYTTKTEDEKEIMIWQKQNGLKIVFKTTDKDLSGNSITLPTFEIYLGEDGAIHLSNCVIDPAPTTET